MGTLCAHTNQRHEIDVVAGKAFKSNSRLKAGTKVRECVNPLHNTRTHTHARTLALAKVRLPFPPTHAPVSEVLEMSRQVGGTSAFKSGRQSEAHFSTHPRAGQRDGGAHERLYALFESSDAAKGPAGSRWGDIASAYTHALLRTHSNAHFHSWRSQYADPDHATKAGQSRGPSDLDIGDRLMVGMCCECASAFEGGCDYLRRSIGRQINESFRPR